MTTISESGGTSRATVSAANTAVPPGPPPSIPPPRPTAPADRVPPLPRPRAGREERIAVRHPHVPVDHLRIERLRPEVLADALGEVRTGRLIGRGEQRA